MVPFTKINHKPPIYKSCCRREDKLLIVKVPDCKVRAECILSQTNSLVPPARLAPGLE